MSKNRNKEPQKGRGYTPKTASASPQKSKLPLLIVSVVLAATVALIAYPYFIPSEGKNETTGSGLKYVDRVIGTGASPTPGKRVTVHYTGTLENGTKFDSSVDRGQPFTFVIGTGSVIKGWDEGVMTMKVGGKRQLIIPPELGYGPRGTGPIPPNSTLIFEIELLDVK